MRYKMTIQARARVRVTEVNRGAVWSALNSLHDALTTGVGSLGDFVPERCEIDLEGGRYSAEVEFDAYDAGDVKDYLRGLLGNRPADANVRVWREDPHQELLQAARVAGSVTWTEYTETETGENLS